MGFFKRSQKQEPIVVHPPRQSRVEVEVAKGASAEAAQKAKEINAHVKDLLVGNGFTLKIYIAAGGHAPQPNRKSR
jgi:hypothetical protein